WPGCAACGRGGWSAATCVCGSGNCASRTGISTWTTRMGRGAGGEALAPPAVARRHRPLDAPAQGRRQGRPVPRYARGPVGRPGRPGGGGLWAAAARGVARLVRRRADPAGPPVRVRGRLAAGVALRRSPPRPWPDGAGGVNEEAAERNVLLPTWEQHPNPRRRVSSVVCTGGV